MSTHDTEDRPYEEWMKARFQGRAETSRTNQQSPCRQGEPNVQTNIALMTATPKRSMNTRAIHGSVQVEFVPNPELTHRNRVEKKGTRRRPAGVIGSGGLEHQRVAGG